ncbi:MAG: tRNA glutamyl-Q(34) synthetase GluQRS [Armatimonadetes bacterium]|nr:tRNA glutamyl-Q(34) synthetase GluQRS [Armatimonadota bacterium]
MASHPIGWPPARHTTRTRKKVPTNSVTKLRIKPLPARTRVASQTCQAYSEVIETTRFAPSPTGFLHLGHVYAAAFARKHGDRMLLRHEDIDATRVRPEYYAAIEDDLAWLGINWDGPVRRQSGHFDDYRAALKKLADLGVTYPCFCTRAEIVAEVSRAGEAPHGPEGPIYPGTCRGMSKFERIARMDRGLPYAVRLDVESALARVGPLTWHDRGLGRQTATPEKFCDVVIARKETPASYHLCVVVDDHLQGVTLVTRAEDLTSSTHVQRLLQDLLGIEPPSYFHHRLLLAPDGKKLSKRDHAETVRSLRAAGMSPAEVLQLALGDLG